MSRITEEQVKYVANLARLAITDEEAARFTEQLDAIIEYAALLNEVDTDHVEPMTHVLDIKNVFREDKARHWLSQEDALKNAPEHRDGQFRVPSIID